MHKSGLWTPFLGLQTKPRYKARLWGPSRRQEMYLHLQVDFLAHHKHLPSFGWWEPTKKSNSTQSKHSGTLLLKNKATRLSFHWLSVCELSPGGLSSQRRSCWQHESVRPGSSSQASWRRRGGVNHSTEVCRMSLPPDSSQYHSRGS